LYQGLVFYVPLLVEKIPTLGTKLFSLEILLELNIELLLSVKNILRQRKKLNSMLEFSFFFVSLFSAQNIFET
jgi:hypothetical protein